jgi:signal transduction histidine kinase
LLIVQTRRGFVLGLLLKYVVFVAVGVGCGGRPDVLAMLLLVIVIEIGFYTDHPTNLFLDLAAILGALPFLLPLLISPSPTSGPDRVAAVLALVSAVMVALLACLSTFYREQLAALSQQQKRMGAVIAELTKANLGYLRVAQSTEERSILTERRRLTAELHDTIGYTLTNLAMMMEAAKDIVNQRPDDLLPLIESAREQALLGIEETRKSLRLLRAQEVNSPDGLAAMERMIATFESATSIKIERHYASFPNTCGAEIDGAFFHFVQESLINAFRHGKATSIRIVFSADDQGLQASVSDNGWGCVSVVEGIGIAGMRERLGKLGGTLVIAEPGEGFTISARVPLKE